MYKKIKSLLREYANEDLINRIYNMIKDDFYLDSYNKVKTNLVDSDGNQINPDTRSGLYVQLKRGGGFYDKIIMFLMESFGVIGSDAEKIYDKVSFNLKLNNWIEVTPEVIYEDFFKYGRDNAKKYTIDLSKYAEGIASKVLDVRNLNEFKAFLYWYGFTSNDAHDNVTHNFYNHITENDYLYMQEKLIDLIEFDDYGYN